MERRLVFRSVIGVLTILSDVKKKRVSEVAIVPIRTKLTVQKKTLNYAIKSVLVKKGNNSTVEESSNPLIKTNIFNIIDIKNSETQNCFPSKILPINENLSNNKSIFHEIEKKFKDLGPILNDSDNFYLISDENLQNLIQKKLQEPQILNFWSRTFQNFVYFRGFQPRIYEKITENQSRINEFSSLYEIKLKFCKTPVSQSFIKRKIIRNCNNLSQKQNLGGKKIMATDAKILVEKFSENSTPDKTYPRTSYKTPDNQKISVKNIEISAVKLTPAIFQNNKYIEINRETLTRPKFGCEFNISESQKQYFLSELSKSDKNGTQATDGVFERPKKPRIGCRKIVQTPFKVPNRRLNFSEPIIDENFDFEFLEPSPLISKRKGVNMGVKTTPKRGLEAMLSPNELDIRQRAENIKCKKYDGPPIFQNTPLFKYGPNFYN